MIKFIFRRRWLHKLLVTIDYYCIDRFLKARIGFVEDFWLTLDRKIDKLYARLGLDIYGDIDEY